MDYIMPAQCSETQFRAMWTEFEWENKVNVNTNIQDLMEYMQHIMKSTNMACLTPEHALSGECGFLAANLYARSIFGGYDFAPPGWTFADTFRPHRRGCVGQHLPGKSRRKYHWTHQDT